jgi:MFS family permease
VIGAAVLAISVYRAATQSITHDEARVFLLYMMGSVRHAFTYTGIQNHVLQAFLSRLALTVFPTTAFTIRIPTLVGAAIYCAATIWICERLFDRRWMCWAAVALLTLNPYTLDFLSAARGYGLMLAFLMVAVVSLLPGVSPWPERRAYLVAGVSLGLAIAATTACMFAVAGIVFAYGMSFALQRRWRDGVMRAGSLAAIACIVAAIPLANQLYRATGRDYQNAIGLGGDTFLLQLASLVRASTSRDNPYLTSVSALSVPQAVAFLVFGVAVAATIRLAAMSLRRPHSGEPRERALMWIVAMLAGMAAATIGGHAVLHVTYPQARMALYWVPFVTLALLIAWSRTTATPSRAAGWTLAVLVLAMDVSLFDVTTYADWIPDAPDDKLVDCIVQDHGSDRRHVTVGGSWILEPSMNFYRVTRGLDWMAPIERRPPQQGDDYYVLIEEDHDAVRRLGLRVLYEDPRSGTLVAASPRGAIAGTR